MKWETLTLKNIFFLRFKRVYFKYLKTRDDTFKWAHIYKLIVDFKVLPWDNFTKVTVTCAASFIFRNYTELGEH